MEENRVPTYATAGAAALFILVSLLIERSLHKLKKYLKRKNQRPLYRVVDKMQDELMLLGFISLLLTVLQSAISRICVPPSFSKHMLPCALDEYDEGNPSEANAPTESNAHRRRMLSNLFYNEIYGPTRHLLSEGGSKCRGDHVQFIPLENLHQLHIFIFVLGVMHVVYSSVTVGLGFARVRYWRKWERDTCSENYDGQKDLEKLYCARYKNSRRFLNRYGDYTFAENPVLIWVLCFFRQFAGGVSREDYLTFRLGFLHNHNLGGSFNFLDYVIRSMEVDFRQVIGISWWLWVIVVVFVLININGWYTYFWAAFIPTIITLIIGTKQQHIISTLALQGKRHARRILDAENNINLEVGKSGRTLQIASAIKPDNKLFWFDNPKVLLKLLHFVIFQNAFELAVAFWLLTTYGWNSCYLDNHTFFLIRIVVGILTQLVASYITLPVYALVTQMGSTMKETVFTKDVYEGIVGWKQRARVNKQKKSSPESSTQSDAKETDQTEESTNLPQSEEEPPKELTPIKSSSKIADLQSRTFKEVTGEVCELTRVCERLYGKNKGREIVNKSRVNPS